MRSDTNFIYSAVDFVKSTLNEMELCFIVLSRASSNEGLVFNRTPGLETAANDEPYLPITTSPSFIGFNDENIYCSSHCLQAFQVDGWREGGGEKERETLRVHAKTLGSHKMDPKILRKSPRSFLTLLP